MVTQVDEQAPPFLRPPPPRPHGAVGSLEFTHSPRVYFSFEEA